ncbi:MAG TPA: hypothetical protein VGO47_14810 [Chlamydiales bacterium]|nr:hypothetical protein [Chlamydiales bacterium]
MANDNERNNSSSRRLTATVRERIRARGSSSGSSGGSGGSSGGSGGDDSGSGGLGSGNPAASSESGNNADSGTLGESINSVLGTGGDGDGRNRTGTGTDNGRSDSSDSNGTGEAQAQLGSDNVLRGRRLDTFSESVDVSSIINEEPTAKPKRQYTPRTKKSDNDSLLIPLQIALDFVYGLPVHFGWGKHWELDAEESNSLAVCLKDVLDSFPTRSTKAFLKAIEKWMPVLTLAITVYGITVPRMKQTRELAQKAKEENAKVEQREERPFQPFVN